MDYPKAWEQIDRLKSWSKYPKRSSLGWTTHGLSTWLNNTRWKATMPSRVSTILKNQRATSFSAAVASQWDLFFGFKIYQSDCNVVIWLLINLLVPFINIKWTQSALFRCSARWTCSAKQQLKNVRLVEAHQCRAKSKTLRSSRKTLHTQSQKRRQFQPNI